MCRYCENTICSVELVDLDSCIGENIDQLMELIKQVCPPTISPSPEQILSNE